MRNGRNGAMLTEYAEQQIIDKLDGNYCDTARQLMARLHTPLSKWLRCSLQRSSPSARQKENSRTVSSDRRKAGKKGAPAKTCV